MNNRQDEPWEKSGLRGIEAPQLVSKLPALISSLGSLTFHTYFPGPGLEERLAQSSDETLRAIFQKAQNLRKLSGSDLPYWESILVASWSTAKLDKLIDQALLHDFTREPNTRFSVQTSELTDERVSLAMSVLPSGWVLAVCSKCETLDGSRRHIPMLDFRCAPTPMNLERTRVALKQLGQTRGAILESGRSFHFYGFDLQEDVEWTQFMARSLLLAPFVDTRFVAHRLLEGTSVLRISSSERKPRVPFVVHVL